MKYSSNRKVLYVMVILAIIFTLLPIYPSSSSNATTTTPGWRHCPLNKVVDVASTYYSSYFVDEYGDLYYSGYGVFSLVMDNRDIDGYFPIKIMEGVSSVYANNKNIFVVKVDGTLWGWGDNQYGQIGDGTAIQKSAPVKILDNVISFKSDLYSQSAYAITVDGGLWSWGQNMVGQLGDGTTTNRYAPAKIMDNVQKMDYGSSTCFALKTDGSIWGWGSNNYGQLCDGTTVKKTSPIKILENVTDINTTSFGSTAYAIKEDGSLWSWGRNNIGEMADGTSIDSQTPKKIMENVTAVNSGDYFAFAIKNDGSLWSWGANNPEGVLGDGGIAHRHYPVQILENVASIHTGDVMGRQSVFAIKNDGTLWSWGDGDEGQLGTSSGSNRYSPGFVMNDVSSIDYCGLTTFAIKNDGTLWGWGNNGNGQLGDGTKYNKYVPTQIKYYGVPAINLLPTQVSSQTYSMVAARSHTSYALQDNGTLWSWGANSDGQLGDGTITPKYNPVKIMEDATSVYAGNRFAFAIKSDGSLWGWGNNYSLQLNDGTRTDRTTPVKVMDDISSISIDNSYAKVYAIKFDQSLWVWGGDMYSPLKVLDHVDKVVAGGSVFAIQTDGTLWAWGNNYDGQLGDGTTVNRYQPTKIMENVASVTSNQNSNSVFAIQTDGSMWSWGNNEFGQLGDNTTVSRPTPVKILDGVSSASIYYDTSFALKSDGSLWGWGSNQYGQLGVGTVVAVNTPVKVLNDVETIKIDGFSAFAQKTDGSLWAWGENNFKQLGHTESTNYLLPQKVFENITSITADQRSVFAIKTDGSLWSWGINDYGQLGIGSITNYNYPSPLGRVIRVGETNLNQFWPLGIWQGRIEIDGTPANYDGTQKHTILAQSPLDAIALSSDGYFQMKQAGTASFRIDNLSGDIVYREFSSELGMGPQVAGFENGKTYYTPVPILFNNCTASLNGQPVESGSILTETGDYEVVITDLSGQVYTPIQFSIDCSRPVITISDFDTTVTNQDITVTATTSNGELNASNFTFTQNGSFRFIATDDAGKISSKIVTVNNIDKTAPVVTSPANNSLHTANVLVEFSGGVGTLNGEPIISGTTIGIDGEYQLRVSDVAGNSTEVLFTVDKPLEILGVHQGDYVNHDVTIQFNEGSATLNGADIDYSHFVSQEGEYNLVVTDSLGVAHSITFTIDKTPPIISIDPYIIQPFNGSIEVTASTNEGNLNTYSHLFIHNGSYTFIATDLAGNQSSKVINIDNIYFIVEFNSQGGSEVTPATSDFGETIFEPLNPSRVGYTFGGWHKDPACLYPWNFVSDSIQGNQSLYAKWTLNTYLIKFNINGGTSGTIANLPMTYNTAKALTTNTFNKNGYVFLGWATSPTGSVVYKDKASVKNLSASNGATVNLYAKWGAPITSATSYNYNSVKVSWATAGGATSYRIYRATSAGGTYSLVNVAASTVRSYVNTGLTTGKTYYFKVSVVAGGKTYHHSTYKYAKPIPTTPTISLSKYSSTSVKVSWSGVSGASGYQIFRAASATGTYTYLYTASSKARSWINTGRTPGKYYYYKVRAYHLEGTTKIYGSSSAVKYIKM